MPVTKHGLRCLGAIVALIEQSDGRKQHFSRNEIGQVACPTASVQFRTMDALADAHLVMSDNNAAVRLVQSGRCTCGCDRWTITLKGQEVVRDRNVKVPALWRPGNPVDRIHPWDTLGFGTYPRDLLPAVDAKGAT